jgi:hypothetical protein
MHDSFHKPQPQAPFDWRARLDVHAACKLFPPLPEAELRELAEDIKANGLRAPIVAWEPEGLSDGPVLIDGRNRLDALALLGLLYETGDHHVGLKTWNGTKWSELSGDRIHFQHFHGDDPLALALSLNVHRRHLTAEQKRELIAKVLKARPEASNVTVAKQVKADDKTVAKVRSELEATSEIPRLEKTVGADGKRRARPLKGRAKPKAAIKGKTKAASQGKLRVRHVDIIAAWNDAPLEERTKAIDSIGLKPLLAALPQTWVPLIEEWVTARLKKETAR